MNFNGNINFATCFAGEQIQLNTSKPNVRLGAQFYIIAMELWNNNSETDQNLDNDLTDELITIYFFYSLIGFLTIVANSFVLFLISRHEFLRTTTNLCLACLACSDLLAGFLVTPLVIACSFKYQFEVCLGMDLTQRFIAVSTILHLLIVAFERYLMICQPMTHPFVATKPRLLTLIAGVWCFSLVSSLIQLTWIIPTQERHESIDLSKIETIYDLVWVFVLVCIPLLIIITAYTRILLVLRKQLRSIAKQYDQVNSEQVFKKTKRERKAIFIYGAMSTTFVVSWFSYILSALLVDFGIEIMIPRKLANFLPILRHSTGFVNPILYTFIKGDFIKAIRLTFKRHGRAPNQSRNQSVDISSAMTKL